LFAASRELLASELRDRALLAVELDAHVPVNWPYGIYDDEAIVRFFLERLNDDPSVVGWWAWYVVFIDEDGERTLVASVGFKGAPRNGNIEIGYGVVEDFRGRGIAPEACRRLIEWALSDARVERIFAETLPQNVASQSVLEKLGFTELEVPPRNGHLQFVLTRGSEI